MNKKLLLILVLCAFLFVMKCFGPTNNRLNDLFIPMAEDSLPQKRMLVTLPSVNVFEISSNLLKHTINTGNYFTC